MGNLRRVGGSKRGSRGGEISSFRQSPPLRILRETRLRPLDGAYTGDMLQLRFSYGLGIKSPRGEPL